MPVEIVRKPTLEQEELDRKRVELAQLELQLAEQELSLVNLRAELAAFEGLYLRRVGVLYAELDEWNARIAEIRAKRTKSPELQSEAATARSQADESRSAAQGQAAEVQPFTPSPELKKLYREAAKLVHPDTATDEPNRVRRDRLMKEVNRAYASGDEEMLRRIISEIGTSPDEVEGSGVAADLRRIFRQLKQIQDRITTIQLDMLALEGTELAKLKAKADLAATEARDLIAEMAASVQGRLNVAREQYRVTTVMGG